MKRFFMICFLFPILYATHAQSIVVKESGGKLIIECKNDQERIIPPDSLNTKHNIRISIEPVFLLDRIEVLDSNGKRVDKNIHSSDKSKEIVGNPGNPTYKIRLFFSNHPPDSLLNVGRVKYDGINGGAETTSAKGTCNCDPKQNEQDNIKKALDLCPDCGDKDYYVYDALCKVLYQRKDGNYERIDDLNKISFQYKKEFKVKIIHINRYIKDVKITAEDLIYESQASGLFNDIFGGTGQLMENLRRSIAAQAGDKPKTEIEAEMKTLVNMIADFLKTINDLKEIRNQVFYQCCETQIICGHQPNISLADLSNSLFEIQIKYNELTIKLKKGIEEKSKLEADIVKHDADIVKLKADIAKSSNATKIKNLEDLKKQKEATEETLKLIPSHIVSIKEQVEAIWSAFAKPDEKQLRTLITFNKNYLKQNFTFSTPPIYAQGNRMKLKVNIDSRDSNFVFQEGLQPTGHQEFEIEGPVLNKWFVSFSSGPFFGIGGNFYQKTYEFTRVPSFGNVINDSSKYILSGAGKTNPPIGLSGFAHFENKFAENFGWGASLGVGLTAEHNPRLTYMLGPSFFVGDKHQFGITAGVAGMQVDALRKDLYPDYYVYNNTQSMPQLKYSKKFSVGVFISLTYTVFTFENKSKAPSAEGNKSKN